MEEREIEKVYNYTHGGTHLFQDEIHRYPNWQTMLNI